jgi:hypothetical protein
METIRRRPEKARPQKTSMRAPTSFLENRSNLGEVETQII